MMRAFSILSVASILLMGFALAGESGDMDKEEAEAFVGLAKTAFAKGDYKKAEAWLDKAQAKHPSPTITELRGDIKAKQGKKTEAIRHYLKLREDFRGAKGNFDRITSKIASLAPDLGKYLAVRDKFIAEAASVVSNLRKDAPARTLAARDLGALGVAIPSAGLSGLPRSVPVRSKPIDAALGWLAKSQEADGHWNAKKHKGTMKTDAGVTGLALLAFLEAGHTGADGPGKWRNNVRRATKWIVKSQAANGAIGGDCEGTEPNGVGYHHPICGLALARAYGSSKNPLTGEAAQKAVNYSVKVHQAKGSGWRYTPGMAADLSITAWFVSQLSAAKSAGLKVPASAFKNALAFIDTVSDQFGKCRYKADWLGPNPTMTAAGMTCRLHMGARKTDEKVSGGANYLLKSLPMWGKKGVGVNMYYWYYGTQAMSKVGGANWRKWKKALDCIPENQRKDGSWDPVGAWATRGGRVYSTAMGVLCLVPAARP